MVKQRSKVFLKKPCNIVHLGTCPQSQWNEKYIKVSKQLLCFTKHTFFRDFNGIFESAVACFVRHIFAVLLGGDIWNSVWGYLEWRSSWTEVTVKAKGDQQKEPNLTVC